MNADFFEVTRLLSVSPLFFLESGLYVTEYRVSRRDEETSRREERVLTYTPLVYGSNGKRLSADALLTRAPARETSARVPREGPAGKRSGPDGARRPATT